MDSALTDNSWTNNDHATFLKCYRQANVNFAIFLVVGTRRNNIHLRARKIRNAFFLTIFPHHQNLSNRENFFETIALNLYPNKISKNKQNFLWPQVRPVKKHGVIPGICTPAKPDLPKTKAIPLILSPPQIYIPTKPDLPKTKWNPLNSPQGFV